MKKLIKKSNRKDVLKRVSATILSTLCLGVGVLTINASENNNENLNCCLIDKYENTRYSILQKTKEDRECLYNLYKSGEIDADEFTQKISKLDFKDIFSEEDLEDNSKEIESNDNKESKSNLKKTLTFGAAAFVILGLSCGGIGFKDYTSRDDRSL